MIPWGFILYGVQIVYHLPVCLVYLLMVELNLKNNTIEVQNITYRQLVDAMNHAEKESSEISDKIIELDKEINEL